MRVCQREGTLQKVKHSHRYHFAVVAAGRWAAWSSAWLGPAAFEAPVGCGSSQNLSHTQHSLVPARCSHSHQHSSGSLQHPAVRRQALPTHRTKFRIAVLGLRVVGWPSSGSRPAATATCTHGCTFELSVERGDQGVCMQANCRRAGVPGAAAI